MRHHVRLLVLLWVGMVVSACTDTAPSAPGVVPSAPSRIEAASAAQLCSRDLARTIYGQITSLASGQTQTALRTEFGKVETACGTVANRLSNVQRAGVNYYVKFLEYYAYKPATLGSLAVIAPAGSGAHFTSVARYIGEDKGTITDASFGADGFIGVCVGSKTPTDNPCTIKMPSGYAGLSVAATLMSDPQSYLFSYADRSALTDCNKENLEQLNRCADITVIPERPFPGRGVDVVMCPTGATQVQLDRALLGHPDPRGTDASFVEISQPLHKDSDLQGFSCPAPKTVSSQVGATRTGVAGLAQRLATFASLAAEFLGPRDAFAGLGTAGGSLGSLSPVGPLDPHIFLRDFRDDQVGTPPAKGPAPPQIGEWTRVESTAPGSILVQGSFSGLGNKPVVLNQGGGACLKSCGRLVLAGVIEGEPPINGIYEVRWTSVQAKPTVRSDAPIEVRASDFGVLAQVAYSSSGSASLLKFNGEVVGTWTPGVPQDFAIQIDLRAKTVRLKINGTLAATTGKNGGKSTFNYLRPLLKNDIKEFFIQFDKIDAGIVGLDDVVITRIGDPI
jgi:hypothetical protein